MARLHAWTYEEDFICCMEYLEFVFNYTGEDKTKNLVEKLKRQLPHISAGSLRMKAQNIKYIAMESGLEDRLSISPLSQCSEQCKKAFADAVEKFNPSVIKYDIGNHNSNNVVGCAASGEIEAELLVLCKKMSIQQKAKLLTLAYELIEEE